MLETFWWRQFLALARSVAEKKPERARAWPGFFDNTEGIGPVKRPLFYRHKSGVLLPFKGRPNLQPIEKKIGVEVHITAVAYGTTKRARKFWENQIREELIPKDILNKFRDGFMDDEGWVGLAAERMALHQRFWKAEYHFVGLLNGDALYNNQITRYTYHGSAGNSSMIGVSQEGNFPGLEKNRKKKHNGWDEHTIETARATIRLAVGHSREQGAPIEHMYAHRQYSKGRVGDPGEGYWKEIGIPMCEELGLKKHPHEKYSTGYEIPREWDQDGRVDYRGRML